MRYSAVQEDSYGVGLGQETPPNDVDQCMMAATGFKDPGDGGANAGEEGSMISNLPLLFASGYPTSLEKITLSELERFITFMVQCSLGHDTAEVISEPQWWPKEVKFSIPLVRPKKITETYMDNLKKLVFRCYTYHRSEYLLRFCSYLSTYPHDKLEYANNYDSTTSLYLKTTGKLLVTFRNENMNYDRKTHGPRKCLLPLNKSKSSYPNGTKQLRRRSAQKQAPSPAMVEPPIEDIYLCDNCDAEFVGLRKMKEHEKLCYKVEPRPITPEYEEAPEIKQDQFMEYFKLRSLGQPEGVTTTPAPLSTENCDSALILYEGLSSTRSSGRIRNSINLTRCPTIPFSSPAGLWLGKKSKMMTDSTQQERLDRIERHLTAPSLSISSKPKWFTKTYEFDRWSVTYKLNKDKKEDEYVHQYNFTDYSGKLALDIRSQLLYMCCKPIYVAVERLTDERLVELMQDPSRYKSPERQVPQLQLRPPTPESVENELASGDMSNPVVIDLDDDDDEEEEEVPEEEIVPPRPPTPIVVQLPVPRQPPVAKVSPVYKSPIIQRSVPRSPVKPRPVKARPTVNYNKRPHPSSKKVIIVSLCSSDEEPDDINDSNPCVSIDENRDPMQKQANIPTFLRSSLVPPHKLAKSCIQPADSTSNWLNYNVGDDVTLRSKGTLLRHAPSVYKNSP